MREYEIYFPSTCNDGRPVDGNVLDRLKRELRERFGGFTYFPQQNEGQWKVGRCVFKDAVTIIRVLAEDDDATLQRFDAIKERLKTELEQEDVLIVSRPVKTL